MVPAHLQSRLVIKALSRSCWPSTKGQTQPWQDEVFQFLCRGLGHSHVCTHSRESHHGEACFSLTRMVVSGMVKDQI